MFFSTKNLKRAALAVSLTVAISACNEKSEQVLYAPIGTGAIINTVADDNSSSALSAMQTIAPYDAVNELLPTVSDTDIVIYGNNLYRLERYQHDTMTKYNAAELSSVSTPIWQYSLLDEGETGSADPHDIVFSSETKAYVLRRGKPKAWIVDPSASTPAAFKTGELDLSQYADADGNPEMDSGVIVNGKLFIVLQRLENYVAQDAYLAVFDVATNSEIETGNNTSFKGIKLPMNDPLRIQYLSENGKIYISGVGSYYDTSKISQLVEVDPQSYAVKTILDPANRVAGSPNYAKISDFVIASATRGYFVDYVALGNNAVYAFNPTTGVVDPTVVAGLSSVNIGAISFNNGELWVGEYNSHSVIIVNGQTGEKIATALT